MDWSLGTCIAVSLITSVFAIRLLKQSMAISSRGLLILGIAGLTVSVAILLGRISSILLASFGVVAFVLSVVALGILSTKEKDIYASFRKKQSIYRFFYFGSRKRHHDVKKGEEESAFKKLEKRFNSAILLGLGSILMGLIFFLWRGEIVYPAILILSGFFFICMGKFYKKKA